MSWGDGVIMEEKISVVIPVYNTEQYLKKCLESVCAQTYKNLEIIVVNDGSTDASLQVCEECRQLDRRLIILNQENQGVSAARKFGVEYATGDYICFVDSDDYIAPDMVENLLDPAFDLVCSGWTKVYGDDEENCHDSVEEGNYSDDNLNYLFRNMIYIENSNRFGIYGYLFCKIFRTKILKTIFSKFNTNIYFAEDEAIVYSYLLHCHSVKVMHQSYYFYFMRNASETHKKDKYFLRNISEYYVYLEDAFSKSEQRHILLPQLEKHILFWIKYGLNEKLGFESTLTCRYLFPDEKMILGKKVVIYGAGKVGYSYHKFLLHSELCKVVLWVDKYSYRNETDVRPVESLSDVEYDLIIIAVRSADLALKIKSELCETNIPEGKIIWSAPKENWFSLE